MNITTFDEKQRDAIYVIARNKEKLPDILELIKKHDIRQVLSLMKDYETETETEAETKNEWLLIEA